MLTVHCYFDVEKKDHFQIKSKKLNELWGKVSTQSPIQEVNFMYANIHFTISIISSMNFYSLLLLCSILYTVLYPFIFNGSSYEAFCFTRIETYYTYIA